MLRFKSIAALIALLAATMGCSSDEPPPPSKISTAYADLLRYRADHANRDSTSYATGVDSVLAVHAMTRESFEAGMHAVGGTTAEINEFFERVNKQLSPPPDTTRRPLLPE